MTSKVARKEARLIIKITPVNMTIDFLQADNVRILCLNRIDNALKRVPPIPSSNSFVNIPT
tara:strand:+ start:394 stop:576 length:183 start_codon:yes stop_codon:yes gene_type:complete